MAELLLLDNETHGNPTLLRNPPIFHAETPLDVAPMAVPVTSRSMFTCSKTGSSLKDFSSWAFCWSNHVKSGEIPLTFAGRKGWLPHETWPEKQQPSALLQWERSIKKQDHHILQCPSIFSVLVDLPGLKPSLRVPPRSTGSSLLPELPANVGGFTSASFQESSKLLTIKQAFLMVNLGERIPILREIINQGLPCQHNSSNSLHRHVQKHHDQNRLISYDHHHHQSYEQDSLLIVDVMFPCAVPMLVWFSTIPKPALSQAIIRTCLPKKTLRMK